MPSMSEIMGFIRGYELAGFRKSWWSIAVIIMSQDDWGFIVLLQRSGFWAQA